MLWVCQCVNFKAQIFIPGPNAEVKIDSNKGIWIWNECSQKVLYQHRISISSINRHTEYGGGRRRYNTASATCGLAQLVFQLNIIQ